MKKISLVASLPMLGTGISFDTSLKVEDCMIGLYVVGHTIGLWVPELVNTLNVKVTESSTIFCGDTGTLVDDRYDLFLSGEAYISGYTGTLDGCRGFHEILTKAKNINITAVPSQL